MKSPSFRLGSLVLVAFLVNLGALRAQQKPADPAAAESQPASRPAAARGTVEGTIRWSGPLFMPREVVWPEGTVGTDVKLEEVLAGHVIYDESLRVSPSSRGIADCCVRYLGAQLAPADSSVAPVFLPIHHVRFDIRAVAVRPGQHVVVRNDDAIGYDVTVFEFGDKFVREARVQANGTLDLGTIDGEGVVLRTKRFPFMTCLVFAGRLGPQVVTTEDGSFRFSNVPPGKASFEFLHPVLGRKTFEVEVKARETARLEVTDADIVAAKRNAHLFDEEGANALDVDGVAIPKSVIRRYVDYMRLRHGDFTLPDSYFTGFVVKQVVLPLAATFAAQKGTAGRLEARAELVTRMLAQGRSFEEVAQGFTEDTGLVFPALLRKKTRLDLDPVLGERVFAAPVGQIVGPVYTSRGLHFFVVEGKDGKGPDETRTFRHLVLRYDPSTSVDVFDRKTAEWTTRAHVQILDGEFEAYVPEGNRR